jgi:competence protein ComEC
MTDHDSAHYPAVTPATAILRLGGGMLAGAWLALQLAAALPSGLNALLALAGAFALLRGRFFPAGLAFGCALAGAALGHALADRLDPALDSNRLEIIGVVEDLPQHEARRLVVTLRLESPAGMPSRARIAWYEPAATPRPGERWRFHAKLQRPRGVVNTGSARREAWLLRQRIGATGYASGPDGAERLEIAADRLLGLRGRRAAWIETTVPDATTAAVLTAIALGFRGGLDAATRDALAATGTGHLLAISGLHVGLAAAAGAFAGGALGRRLGARRRPAGDWAAFGALTTALAYCLLAGMPVSAQRAALMTAAALAALVARRGGSAAAALGGALALVLLADPLAVADPGLWLSFGAVATILAVVMGRRAPPGRLAVVVRIQAALAVGMLACTVAWFGRVSLVGPLANLVAVPWFSVLVVPPTLAGVALSWFAPTPASWLLAVAAKATGLGLQLIEWVADLPAASRRVAAPGPFALACASAGAAWCLLPRPAPGRAIAPLLFAPLLWAGPPPLVTGAFELRVFDIGHGLAVLVRTRTRAMLYDAGPSWPGGDAAAWTVLPAMRALGVRRLDALVVSHGHADHRGGVESVLEEFPGTPALAGFGAVHEKNRPCRRGQSWSWDGVRFSILHPGESFAGGQNDGSCVLLIEAAGGRVLLTGDIEARGERALLAGRARLPVDVVVAPHHGSRTSSGPALVAATRPASVVFSTNWRNRWGFPAEIVTARWQRAGALPLSTERHGEIVMQFDRQGPRPPVLARERACRAWLDCASL